jgi:predicted TIM-barrel fold metal-dependent hydrolase
MIYDANTWVGHWPFLSLPRRTAADLLKQMDKHGIDKALVGSLHGLFYQDAHEANRELVKEIGRRRDRLVPCALLNPAYYGWKRDLKQCREDFGMPILRLTPQYHNYKLGDRCTSEIIEAAHELNMRVAFIGRMVDHRGRHWLDPGRETDGCELAALLEKFPKASFLLLNFYNPPLQKRWDSPKCYCDIVRFVGALGARLQTSIKQYGADRMIFGSTLLMRYAKPTLLALETCALTKAQRERIQWRNLAELVPGIR